jgi:hypothetical protein
MTARFPVAALVLCALSLPASTAIAQHHHRHHHHQIIHNHHGSHFGHNNWSYVVPHSEAHHHHGSYYVHNNGYFYTPTPVARMITGTQTAAVTPIQVVEKPVSLTFGGFGRCDDLAGRLVTDANRLCLDMHYNYQHNPGYAGTYREAFDLLQAAKYVHAKEHQGDREAIRRQVTNMDQLFHRVQQEMRSWSRQHRRQIASGGVIEKCSNVEALLHHLCYDVGIEPHNADEEQAPPPSPVEESAPAPAGTISTSPPSINP